VNLVRVVVAEDHTLVRAGFCALLGGIDGVSVLAEAGDGHEALKLVEELRPHLVLLDIAMPGMSGLDVAGRICKDYPEVRVIILSMHANEEYVLQALRAGARGYLLKDAGTAELELAVRAVTRGETYLSPAVSRHVIGEYLRRQDQLSGPLDTLTSRQREILTLVAEGKTTKEIATKLDLSVKTVESHRTQLMDRLDIHDIAGLVRFAVRMGLVSADR
jgi:DNA-binding NarL/FixJ family response regulator